MNTLNQPRSYLIVFANAQDVAKIDQAIGNKKLGCEKLGEKTYLGFFSDSPQDTYQKLKRELGVAGEVQWIHLPYADITK